MLSLVNNRWPDLQISLCLLFCIALFTSKIAHDRIGSRHDFWKTFMIVDQPARHLCRDVQVNLRATLPSILLESLTPVPKHVFTRQVSDMRIWPIMARMSAQADGALEAGGHRFCSPLSLLITESDLLPAVAWNTSLPANER